MRRPTSLDRIAREGRPKTWETAIMRARAESNDIILPDGLVFPACRPKASTSPAATSMCRPVFTARPPETSGNMSSRMHGLHRMSRRGSSGKSRARSLPASRPTRAAPRRSPAFQIFTLRQSLPPPSPMDKAKESAAVGDSHRRLHISLLRTSPLPDDARRFPPQNDANPPGAPKNRRRQSSAARNGACSPLRRVFRLGLSDESRHLLPRFRPCTATHAPQLCLTESLRHTVFRKVLPKSCLFLLHGTFSMYIFSRIKNKTPLRSKRNNVNERIGLITGMI